MQIKSVQLGMIGTNCYIFWADGDQRCAVVDPGDDGQQVADIIRGLKLTPEAIFLTHGHFDHVLGVPGLRESWPELPVYCHQEDIPEELSQVMFGMTVPTVAAFGNIRTYGEGDILNVGALTVKVLHTPGHTRGSVTLMVEGEDVLFTGDTLFRGSMGRTDLEGGSYADITRSLKKLAELPGNYKVYPGHEGSTSLDTERKTNFYMQEAMKG